MVRWDSKGLHWEELPPERGNKFSHRGPLPSIPDTGWTPPTTFPNLSNARVIAIDCETHDPNLKTLGPGNCRGDGEVVGVSIGVEDSAWYFPVRHTVGSELNLDPDQVFAWLREQLTYHTGLKVGHRLSYDLGWLAAEGVHIPGPFYDTAVAEALLDENRFDYSLDTLGLEYTGAGKVDEALYDWSWRAYGGQQGRAQIANIWRCPPQLAGPYAEADARLPLQIREKQLTRIAQEQLDTVLQVEMGLIPLLHRMRQRGVRVDHAAAQVLNDSLKQRVQQAQGKWKALTGTSFVDSNLALAKVFDNAGVQYLRTEKGNPSFPKHWLSSHPSDLARLVMEIRGLEKSRGTFVDGYILTHSHQGRIHAEINQIRFAGDAQGTRGTIGRFSYTNPNLQNIPSRDANMKRLVRGLFLPDEGEDWQSNDYSQIEYRMLAHFALGPGAEGIRRTYQQTPDVDYHETTKEMIRATTGIQLDRKPTKNINFGLVFGMGEATITESLGIDMDAARELFDAYHEALPFARYTFNRAMATAQSRGYIKTLLGRRRRYSLWECWGSMEAPTHRERAVSLWGERNIRRAFTNSALNNVLQLSAADFIKKAMVDIWNAGICDVLGVPLIQVHDELNWSMPQTRQAQEASREMRHLMENAWPGLSVPVQVDSKRGANWGELYE